MVGEPHTTPNLDSPWPRLRQSGMREVVRLKGARGAPEASKCFFLLPFEDNIKNYRCSLSIMKEIDDTDPIESESECPCCAELRVTVLEIVQVIAQLKAEVADLHHRRRVSRQQATDQDPEWFA